MIDRRNTEISYDWVQYVDDVEAGLWTVRKSVRIDHIKFMTKAGALAFIKENSK